MNYNYVAIRRDGRTITGSTDSFTGAVSAMRKLLNDSFYDTKDNPIERFFVGTRTGLQEYIRSEIANPLNFD